MIEQASAPQGPKDPTGSDKVYEKIREISDEELASGIEITPEVIHRVSAIVRTTNGPVRDRLTDRYNFTPDQDSVNAYVKSGVAKSFAGQTATGAEDVHDLKRRHNSAKWALIGQVQYTCWFNSSVSRYRSYHIQKALHAM